MPNPVEVVEELGIVVDVAELPVGVAILLQRPIRRRREDEMHRLGGEAAHQPGIPTSQHMPRGNPLDARFDRPHLLGILRQLRNRRLRILQLPHFNSGIEIVTMHLDDRASRVGQRQRAIDGIRRGNHLWHNTDLLKSHFHQAVEVCRHDSSYEALLDELGDSSVSRCWKFSTFLSLSSSVGSKYGRSS